MLGNKICVTRRGLQMLTDQRNQFPVVVAPIQTAAAKLRKDTQNLGSLPSLSILSSSRYQNKIKNCHDSRLQLLGTKRNISEQLSKLSMALTKYQKIGIKKLMVLQEDKNLAKILNSQSVNQQKYIQKIIPDIIRRTRNMNKTNNLNSRYTRSHSYTDRLLKNYKSQISFGFSNTVKRKIQNQQQTGKSSEKRK